MATTMVTEPVMLDSTGQDLVAATWAVANILSEGRTLTPKEVKGIVKSGGGAKMFPVGTTLTVQKENGTAYPFVFMHHGTHEDGTPYAHLRLMKALHLLQFDSAEAFYYAENGLSAGVYHFNMPAAYGSTPAGNYKFTLGTDVPAGGQLVLPNINSATVVDKNVTVYDSASSTVASQTAAVSSGDGGVSLGLLQVSGDPDNANMNNIQRASYGNNNYAQSAMRQWLNSSAAAGSVWNPTHKFDRPPSWNASQAGFLSLLPQDFIDIVDEITYATVTNTVFEIDYSKTSSYSLKDKFWLPSRYQIFGSTEGSDLGEIQWDYYHGASDIDRIMYDANGVARVQWLRSPNVSYAYYVRSCSTAGTLYGYGAYYAYAASPACEI